jgi:hypothetical protein
MSPTELRALIESDSEALALARSGAADLCAARCVVIAPKVVEPKRLGDINIVQLYADPAVGETVCQTIEAVAQSNPVVKRAWRWAEPGKPGLDVGDLRVRAMLTLPVEQGGVGLTQQQAAPILACAEVSPVITGADVSTAYPYPPQD